MIPSSFLVGKFKEFKKKKNACLQQITNFEWYDINITIEMNKFLRFLLGIRVAWLCEIKCLNSPFEGKLS